MRKIFKVIDAASDWAGKVGCWFSLALVLIVSTEVTMRYAFNRPTMWGYETSLMLGCAMYALGFAYAQRHKAHIRVDVFYIRLSPRGKAMVDAICGVIIFLPLIAFVVHTSWVWTIRAWAIKETMVETYWYPPVYPLRTAVALGFSLLALQGLAQLLRDFYLVIRNKAYD